MAVNLMPTPWLLENGRMLWFADTLPLLATDGGPFSAGDFVFITYPGPQTGLVFKCITAGGIGTGNAPLWQEVAQANEGFRTVTVSTTVQITDDILLFTSTVGVKLPEPTSQWSGKMLYLKAGNVAGVVAQCSALLDTGHTLTLTGATAAARLGCDGTQWWVLGFYNSAGVS